MTDREAYKLFVSGRPVWQVSTAEVRMFNPSVIPDAVARGFVLEAGSPAPSGNGGPDMFGVNWIFDPAVGGSMVRPGSPLLEDMNDWESVIRWPDVASWGWEESVEKNRGWLGTEKYNVMPFMTGWFERLISLMDFSGAVLALIDEDQQDAVNAFLERLTDLYIDILDRAIAAFPLIDGFWIHDDWGGRQNTFFSPAVCERMIVPHMRRLTDHLHALGKHCDLHSCGQLKAQVPNMIAAGWDSWTPQDINDTRELYHLFGDRLSIGVIYDWPAPGASEAEQRKAAAAFVDEFCDSARLCTLNDMRQPGVTPIVREELKMLSMKRFAGE